MNEYYGNYPNMSQPQIRQYSYFFVKDKGEAFNWAIAPGSLLVFKDQDNIHFYTKTLGYSPYDRPVFEVFTKETVEQQEQSPDSNYDEQFQALRNEISGLQSRISEMSGTIKSLSDNRKNGGK